MGPPQGLDLMSGKHEVAQKASAAAWHFGGSGPAACGMPEQQTTTVVSSARNDA